MDKSVTTALLSGAMLLLPMPLSAQTAEPQTAAATGDDPVVVTARPIPQKAEVRQQIGAVTGHPRSDMPLMRFRQPVCIGTAGLPVAASEEILRRMMATVQSLGMRMAPDGCRPNILVLFADDPQAQLLRLRTQSPEIFGDLTRPAVSRILKSPGPVYAWNAAIRVSRDGDQPFQQDNWLELKVGAASRLLTPIRQDIAASVVVIEKKALLNKTLGQIADFAVMRGMAATRPVADMAMPSILTLFDKDAAPPAELTDFDRGLLKGLYQSPPHALASQQVANMARTIQQEAATE
ncbi:hypothetical protein SUS17_149 [Sphingomonas sp. S17]|uniref:DUF2927 domain-containing protein n=2 Tax=Sphingomonas paucimobilis TaxID=13689 RepID=A0A411LF28_SPHPI|nr:MULTISPECIES: hypothetical protein [Sphingomonas]EGI56712.1 hypothetical protein SUS17_149 [Sphingomonas sp. S17]MBQ1480156.1 hypothetical protein [Sphingomonas sp.]MCM3678941.1 hypothetical protein [Sphingomonas paucimobilis]MDG5971694.1 hypothetical protein [Sphingomonas paucimobilis]NNG58293.1 hypothetical protein [Sphingomonas paucimobilis]